MAYYEQAAGTWKTGNFQPVVLRRGVGGAGASRDTEGPEDSTFAGDQEYLGGALRGHPTFRAAYGAQWNGNPEILPERVEEGTEGAIPEAARGAGEELEVFGSRYSRASVLGRLPEGLRRHDREYGYRARPLVCCAGGQ